MRWSLAVRAVWKNCLIQLFYFSVIGCMPVFAQLTATLQMQPQSSAGQNPPLTITLQDALQRAKANTVAFQTALTNYAIARQATVQARAALLPGVSYNNQFIYTQGNGTASGRFIANNGVHEYVSEGTAHEAIGPLQFADYYRTRAAEALARAQAEIAARGLVVTVVQTYYALVVAQRKYATAQQGTAEARSFLDLSQKLELGGEVAHSDAIKAQLQYQDQLTNLDQANLAMGTARINLALLLFPNFNQDFTVVDDLRLPPPLPPFAEIEQQTKHGNPELAAALAAVREANKEVLSAQAGHFPTLALDYFYGLDANRFEATTRGVKNLGYSATATLNLPVFDWGAIRSKVKQADLRRQLARVELTAAQRKLLGDLQAFYAEAQSARSQLAILRSSAELAAESLRLSILRYKTGEALIIEVTDAQRAVIVAQNAFDDGEARYYLALAYLQTLTGTL